MLVEEPEQPDALTEAQAPRGVAAFYGFAITLAGLGVAVFVAWMLRGTLFRGRNTVAGLTVAALATPFAWLFLEAGIRLVAYKPSRYGSVLAHTSWMSLSIWCAGASLWVLYLGLRGNLVVSLLGGAIFGMAAWHCHRHCLRLKAKGASVLLSNISLQRDRDG